MKRSDIYRAALEEINAIRSKTLGLERENENIIEENKMLTEVNKALEHALRTLYFAIAGEKQPEQFPGHHEAYLKMIAIPRAEDALQLFRKGVQDDSKVS